MKTKILEIWHKSDAVIKRYPLVLTMAFAAAFAAVIFIDLGHLNYRTEQKFFPVLKLVLTACLGISVMFAAEMAAERFGRRLLWELLGILLLALFYLVLPQKEQDFTQMYAFIIVPVFILSHLLVSFGAFIGGQNERHFWLFNKNLFINAFLTGIFTGVLTGGIVLAIVAVSKLFDLDIADYRFSQAALFLLIFGSCFIFLLFSRNGLSALEQDSDYPQILKFFVQFVLIPLLLIYLVILYCYAANILLVWQLPQGWVSYLILAYAVVGIFAQLLIYPLKKDSEKTWVKIFSKAFYFTLLPLLVLLFTAIKNRILQYGFTEPRYYVLLLALWLTAVVFYFTLLKVMTVKFIPVSLFAFGVFALMAPRVNALSVSKCSQKDELMKVLNENQLLEQGKINFNKAILDSTADELADKFSYLATRKETDFLTQLIPAQPSLVQAIRKHEEWAVKDVLRSLFKNTINTNSGVLSNGIQLASELLAIPVSDYNFMMNIIPSQSYMVSGQDIIVVSQPDSIYQIHLEKDGRRTASYDLMPFLKQAVQPYKDQRGRVTVPEISHAFELGGLNIKCYIRQIDYLNRKSGESIFPQDVTFLVKVK